ncbi:MAG: glycosyltransferase family 39 protein [Salinivirgaceae bacterium]
MIQTLLNKKTAIVVLLVFIGILASALLYMGLVAHPTSDSNYYIPIAWDVLDGYVPTYNVDTEYTPFVYYILAFFFWIFSNTNHTAAVIVVFLFSLANSLLLYHLLKNRIKLSLTGRLIFICLYIFSLFQLTAFQVFLEPFQVFFALLSFIFLTDIKNSISKIVLSGIFMGISIMCKQYSALFAVGIGLWMLLEFYKGNTNFKNLLINGTIWSLGVLLPYFLFVLITKATFYNSLVSFGFIGGAANTYIAYKPSFLKIEIYEMAKVIGLHMIELIPFIIYPIYRKYNKIENNITNVSDGIYLIGLLSLVSIYVRQYSHYFQLVIPWSILLWAVLLNDYWKKSAQNKTKGILRHSVLFLFVISLPTVCYMSPKLIYYHFKTNVIENKSYGIDFTKEALTVFEEGSSVYVRGNNLLYVSCGYRNPTHNYYFTSPVEMISEGKVPQTIDKIILPKLPATVYEVHKDFFIRHGFNVLVEKEYGLYLILIN